MEAWGAEDKLRLRQESLPDEELSKVLLSLTGKDPSGPPDDCLPLYYREDGEEIAAAMPVFNERGVVLTEHPPPAASLVDLSSGDPSSEAIEEGEGKTSALM